MTAPRSCTTRTYGLRCAVTRAVQAGVMDEGFALRVVQFCAEADRRRLTMDEFTAAFSACGLASDWLAAVQEADFAVRGERFSPVGHWTRPARLRAVEVQH